jgi:hypothetical protein
MSEGYNFIRLREAILARSHATDWETARKEWGLVTIFEADEPETCLCGHHPIMEICEISNRLTKGHAEVGNCCVKRFLGLRSDLIFTGLKRIRKDIDKSLNADSITYFREKAVLNDWEYAFLQSTMRKKILSSAQAEKRRGINRKVLAAVARRGFQGPN